MCVYGGARHRVAAVRDRSVPCDREGVCVCGVSIVVMRRRVENSDGRVVFCVIGGAV